MNFQSAFKEIYRFFISQELKTKRVKIFQAVCLIPPAIILIVKIISMTNPYAVTAEEVFARVMTNLYFQVMIPILALLYGSMIINEEVDNKTLIYLTTSPVPKSSIVFGKFSAYSIISLLPIIAGLAICFLLININHLTHPTHTKEFLIFAPVTIFALVAYMSLFTLLGAILKRSIILGFFFIFGWELIVQYFPGMTQKLTIVHWIKSLLPSVPEEGSVLSFFMTRLEPSSTVASVIVLTTLIVVCLTATSYIFTRKEYIMADSV